MAKAQTDIVHDGTTYPAGSDVTKSKLKANDDQWDALVEAGAVGDEVPEAAPAVTSLQKTSDIMEGPGSQEEDSTGIPNPTPTHTQNTEIPEEENK